MNFKTTSLVLLFSSWLVSIKGASFKPADFDGVLTRPVLESWFPKLQTIVDLDLNFMQITHLAPNVFAGLGNVMTLNLKDNWIDSIVNETFIGLPNLRKLILSGMAIKSSSIDEDAFIGLDSLEDFELSSNNLETIDRDIFKHIKPTLKSLVLSNSYIANISATALNGFNKLEYLDIHA